MAGRQGDGRLVPAADLPQGRFQPQGLAIGDPSRGDVQAIEPAAVALLVPAHVVVDVPDLLGPRRRQGISQAGLDLGLELLQSPVGQEVLQPRTAAIGAVAEVAEDGEDGADHVERLFGADHGQGLGQGGKGVFQPRRHAHAPAHQHVVAGHLKILAQRQQAHVLGVEIDAIVAGQADGHLEFPRQVAGAVERLDRVAVGGVRRRGLAQPDFAVGGRAGPQVPRQVAGHPLDLAMDRVAAIRRRATHDVAGGVAAGPQRRQPHFVEAPQRPHQVLLRHAVELQALPGGDPESAAAHLIA